MRQKDYILSFLSYENVEFRAEDIDVVFERAGLLRRGAACAGQVVRLGLVAMRGGEEGAERLIERLGRAGSAGDEEDRWLRWRGHEVMDHAGLLDEAEVLSVSVSCKV